LKSSSKATKRRRPLASIRSGNIYDLGYQRYLGARLGRRHAIWALYLQSLRVVFGIGRSFWAKASAFGILAIASLPAIVQVGVAALSPEDVEITTPEDYYGLIDPLIAIFCAIVAPDLVGRDQRNRTLSLYFSRALRREDYAIAKYAAFITAMLTITAVPQVLMFIGNAAAADEVPDYLKDHWHDLPGIAGSALLVSCLIGGIGLAVASQTPRRAYSTVGIVAVFTLGTGIAAAFFESAGPQTGQYALLLSPFHVVQGFTFWFFNAPFSEEEQLSEANIAGIIFFIDAIIISVGCLIFVIRRYMRIPA
jgi:ABC-2 type transport system permease protein